MTKLQKTVRAHVLRSTFRASVFQFPSQTTVIPTCHLNPLTIIQRSRVATLANTHPIKTQNHASLSPSPTKKSGAVRMKVHGERFQLEIKVKRLCSDLYTQLQSEGRLNDSIFTKWENSTREWMQNVQNTVSDSALKRNSLRECIERHLHYEIELGYESAIAICMKKRLFDVADRFLTLMLRFYPKLCPTDATFSYLIHGIGLRTTMRFNRERSLTVRELKQWTAQYTDKQLLRFLATENRPHYLKSNLERNRLRHQIHSQVSRILQQYEKLAIPVQKQYAEYSKTFIPKKYSLKPLQSSQLDDDAHRLHPYVTAIQICARNHVSYRQTLQLCSYANSIPMNPENTAEKYAALIQSARWDEIPTNLHTFLRKFDTFSTNPMKRSELMLQVWSTLMQSICNSFTDRYFHHLIHVNSADIQELQNIFQFIEQTLSKIDIHSSHFSSQFQDVCAIRLKAAAICGDYNSIIAILNQFIQFSKQTIIPAHDSNELKNIICSAIEVFSIVPIQLLNISLKDIHSESSIRNSPYAQKIDEMEAEVERIVHQFIPDLVSNYHASCEKLQDSQETKDLVELHLVQFETETELKNILRDVRNLTEDIIEMRGNDCRFAHMERIFSLADKYVSTIVNEWQLQFGKEFELDIRTALMNQYFTCVNRIGECLLSHNFSIGRHIMKRVMHLLDEIDDQFMNCDLSVEEWKIVIQPKLNKIYHYAIRTAGMLRLPLQLNDILLRKYRLIEAISPMKPKHIRFEREEYDLLLFTFCATNEFSEAYNLFQEMQNVGLSPSQDTMHRMVHMQIKTLNYNKSTSTNEYSDDDSDQDSDSDSDVFSDEEEGMRFAEDNEDLGGEEALKKLPYSGNHQIADVIGFIVDQYNLSQVIPYGKTSCLVLNVLINSGDVYELKRFISILESMNAMTCTLHVWFQHRMRALGLTIKSTPSKKVSK